MADASGPAPIIIKKKKGGHGHGHHGGAWKVAYADFVTAMMAFFLLLWLLNVSSDEQKRGIAEYFTPEWVSRSRSGSGDILGGDSIQSSGSQSAPTMQPITTVPETAQPQEDGSTDAAEEAAEIEEDEHAKRLAEEEQLKAAEIELKQAIQDAPDLVKFLDNLIIERSEEGLRIQLVDQERQEMFPLGSAAMPDYTYKLLGKVSQIVQRLPNKIKLTGHTDSKPYPPTAAYTNWELSADRANASRRALVQSGLSDDRIAWVVGKADRDHLFKEEPLSPKNRRISIVILRDEVYQKALRDNVEE